ncbi:glycoside hydrolase family 5 protein [Parapedobacter deserti]|uniref:Glycoside hydrolase family 5 protein n=1 Tax=Parapedobacter deserti TaxID=1912957 RepID=A0ABV7JIU8_9SPHI
MIIKIIHYISFILLVHCFSCKDKVSAEPTPEPKVPNEQPDPLDMPFSKGVNLSDWFLANSAEDIGKTVYKKTDFEQIKSLGVDVVRVPVRFFRMTGPAPDYALSEVFFEKLDYALDLAEEVGLHLIIDNHSYFSSTPFPQAYGEQQITKVWEQIAVHCKDRSALIHYELFNEPDGNYMATEWPAMQGRMISAIRAIDSTHTIIVGGADANGIEALAHLPEYDDPNLIYTFHFYDPFLFTHQGASWTNPSLEVSGNVPFPYNAATMPAVPPALVGTSFGALYDSYAVEGTIGALKNQLDKAISFAKARNVRLFCGEFGVLMNNAKNTDRCQWYEVVRTYFEEHDIAWTTWDYHNSFGLFVPGEQYRFDVDLNVPLLEALGLNVPPTYNSDGPPNVSIYTDELSGGMTNESHEPSGSLNFADESISYEGLKSIRWQIGDQWSSIGISIWPTFDLEAQYDADYKLRFAIKSPDKANLQVRFVQYKEGHLPWRNAVTLTDAAYSDQDEWTVFTIPLSDFGETGAVSNGYHEPIGAFTWRAINRLEFAVEGNEDLVGAVLHLDHIAIIK